MQSSLNRKPSCGLSPPILSPSFLSSSLTCVRCICRETNGSQYAEPTQRSFQCPGSSQTINLPDDAEALHLCSAQSSTQSMEALLLAPLGNGRNDYDDDPPRWRDTDTYPTNRHDRIDLKNFGLPQKVADLEFHMKYGNGNVHLLLAVYFSETSQAEILEQSPSQKSNPQEPAAIKVPSGDADTIFMENKDPHVYTRGIYVAQCTPNQMKVYWMLWDYHLNSEFYDRYRAKE